jgi:adenosylhomocysteine nucleosidase
MRTLVVIPLQAELDSLLAGCRRRGHPAETGVIGRLPIFRLPSLGLTLARGGTGKAQFALQAQHLLDVGPGWDLLVCAGAAGALVDHLNVADLLVATKTIEHDWLNRFGEEPLPTFEPPSGVLEALRQLPAPDGPFALHFGAIASGDEDIVDPARRRALRESTGALAAAWEGAGGARAARFCRVPFLEVRALTDGADAHAPGAFTANLDLAMDHLAWLFVAWLGPVP